MTGGEKKARVQMSILDLSDLVDHGFHPATGSSCWLFAYDPALSGMRRPAQFRQLSESLAPDGNTTFELGHLGRVRIREWTTTNPGRQGYLAVHFSPTVIYEPRVIGHPIHHVPHVGRKLLPAVPWPQPTRLVEYLWVLVLSLVIAIACARQVWLGARRVHQTSNESAAA